MDFLRANLILGLIFLLVLIAPESAQSEVNGVPISRCSLSYDFELTPDREIIIKFSNPLEDSFNVDLVEVASGRIAEDKLQVGASTYKTIPLDKGEYFIKIGANSGCKLIIGSDNYRGIIVE